eukprot:TRINITY_DN5042_c0_g1_i3.p1 TRINITY_DN5042_c0_g1~~TRINITY_DN5042_c0_g1_i3.p1  ORF type:complete len:832 (+),score=235.54 TRINITY_DN5042_c0_g1_i3:3-2498(+)
MMKSIPLLLLVVVLSSGLVSCWSFFGSSADDSSQRGGVGSDVDDDDDEDDFDATYSSSFSEKVAENSGSGHEGHAHSHGHDGHGSGDLKDLFFAPGNKENLVVPMSINVALLGFNGDGGHKFRLSASEFQEAILESLPAHVPSSLQSEKALNVEYYLQYNVIHLQKHFLSQLEDKIASNMRFDGKFVRHSIGKGKRDPIPTFSVDGKQMEDSIQAILAKAFKDQHVESSLKSSYTVVFVNPNKRNILSNMQRYSGDPEMKANMDRIISNANEDEEDMFVYRYRYGDSSVSQMFVGQGRFVFVDLTAGPCRYGGSEVGEGTVSEMSLPRLHMIHADEDGKHREEEGEEDMTTLIQSQLASVVVQSVQYLFAPDTRYDAMLFAEKVLVPVIVFRNHRVFNPFRSTSQEFHIDLKKLQEQVNRLALPGQEIQLVTGIHSLHDHEHIAFALSKAKRAHTMHQMGEKGKYEVVVKRYVDRKILAHELEDAADVLASGLISSLSSTLSSTFYNPNVPNPEMVVQDKDEEAVDASAPLPSDESSKDKTQTGSVGTRILPVYVMSLIGSHDDDLMMDDLRLHHANQDFVVVLQTNGTAKRMPMFSETKMLYRSARNPNQEILAGLLKALGGISAPTTRFSQLHQRSVTDFSWAIGAHPFGPFSNETQISQIFVDSVLRNSIISRINAAFHTIQESVALVDDFAKEYVQNPFGEEISHKSKNAGSYIELLYHQPGEVVSPLARKTVASLHQDLKEIEKKFFHVADMMYDFRLKAAYKFSSNFDRTARVFQAYVESQVQQARTKLECCSIHHETKQTSTAWSLITLVAIFWALYFVFRRMR